jgi:hypothetical protein
MVNLAKWLGEEKEYVSGQMKVDTILKTCSSVNGQS